MEITVSFFGPVRRPWPESSRQLEVSEGSTIQFLMEVLGFEASDLKRMAAVIGGKRRPPSALLKNGDHLQFVLMAGGG